MENRLLSDGIDYGKTENGRFRPNSIGFNGRFFEKTGLDLLV